VTLLRIVLSVLLAGFAVLLTATPALAHTTLKSSSPTDGAQLASPPDVVTLTFEEAVTLAADPVSVVGPDGEAWTVGTATVTGASVQVPVEASGPAGQYSLRYTVIADDGDPVRGTVHFTLTNPATPATAVATADALDTATAEAAPATVVTAAPVAASRGTDSGDSSAWAYIALAVVVIGVLAGMAFIFRSRRSGRSRL
jgi:copper resistance protein C